MTAIWDEPKRRRTLAERGLDFADAEKVFAGNHFTRLSMTGASMASRGTSRQAISTADSSSSPGHRATAGSASR
jgi:uncharacterized DUF497 family protein